MQYIISVFRLYDLFDAVLDALLVDSGFRIVTYLTMAPEANTNIVWLPSAYL